MKRISLLVAFTMLAVAAWAHEDTILFVGPDDVILGLPAAYRPTRLHVVFSEGDTGALQRLTFESSGRETTVKPCLLGLVPDGSLSQLSLSGSWYHNESTVPHYVQVLFRHSQHRQGLPGRELPDAPGISPT